MLVKVENLISKGVDSALFTIVKIVLLGAVLLMVAASCTCMSVVKNEHNLKGIAEAIIVLKIIT